MGHPWSDPRGAMGHRGRQAGTFKGRTIPILGSIDRPTHQSITGAAASLSSWQRQHQQGGGGRGGPWLLAAGAGMATAAAAAAALCASRGNEEQQGATGRRRRCYVWGDTRCVRRVRVNGVAFEHACVTPTQLSSTSLPLHHRWLHGPDAAPPSEPLALPINENVASVVFGPSFAGPLMHAHRYISQKRHRSNLRSPLFSSLNPQSQSKHPHSRPSHRRRRPLVLGRHARTGLFVCSSVCLYLTPRKGRIS